MPIEDKLFSKLTFSKTLKEKILEYSEIKDIPAGTEVMKEGQFIKLIPIVLNGLVKVSTRHEDKELLLYYIEPNETCIISFNAALTNTPSKAFALTEQDTKVLLMPSNKVFNWINEFPELINLFFNQYNTRYNELIEMVNKVLFEKMDKRLFEYLLTASKISDEDIVKRSHQQIANDLGTAREVISRVLKKLEYEKMIVQDKNGIKITKM
ncbi:MAG TPA: Crp/Fnr family transcriptional regulator [Prolixibacteraceae bacterium]|nr:Crp/Fnr family transcriptional regulator [Prolixibacteraceae bacterium]